MSNLINDFNPLKDCKAPPLNIPNLTIPWLINLQNSINRAFPKGQYYGQCPCPNGQNGKPECPDGYDNTFPNYTNIDNPIDKSISLNNFSNKKCGDIAGIVPSSKMWKKDVFDDCVKLYNLQKTLEENEKKITPYNTIIKSIKPNLMTTNTTANLVNSDNIKEPFEQTTENTVTKDDYLSMYDNKNGLQKRITSYNNSLIDNIKKDFSLFNNQKETKNNIIKVNNKWKNIVDEINENDNQVNNQIGVKTRLIEINEEASRQKNKTIFILSSSFISVFIFIISWIAYLTGKISIMTMFSFFFIGVLLFIILVFLFNPYSIKEFKKIGDKIEKKIKDWMTDNCDCPDDTNNTNNTNTNDTNDTNDTNINIDNKYNTYIDSNGKKDSYTKMMDRHKYDTESIYYYDGKTNIIISSSDLKKNGGNPS